MQGNEPSPVPNVVQRPTRTKLARQRNPLASTAMEIISLRIENIPRTWSKKQSHELNKQKECYSLQPEENLSPLTQRQHKIHGIN